MRASIVITVCILTSLGAAFAVYRHFDRTVAQSSRDLSKMISVRITTAEAMSAHYKQHGSFPRSLSGLPLQSLRWGDEGSSARDLNSWHYNSDGQSFTMTWTNTRGLELFLGGKGGQLFYLRDEARWLDDPTVRCDERRGPPGGIGPLGA